MTAADYTGDSPTCWTCGDDRFINVNRRGQSWSEPCPDCGDPNSEAVRVVLCPKCEGAGEYEDPAAYWAGPDAERHPCLNCLTTGHVASRKKW